MSLPAWALLGVWLGVNLAVQMGCKFSLHNYGMEVLTPLKKIITSAFHLHGEVLTGRLREDPVFPCAAWWWLLTRGAGLYVKTLGGFVSLFPRAVLTDSCRGRL